MFIETPEARQMPTPRKTSPDRFVITLTPYHRWDVTDRLGVYRSWRGSAQGARYKKESLIAYESGDLEEAIRCANYADACERNTWGH